MPRVFVGVSGYDYLEWRGSFYPAAMPRSAWLDYALESFDSIELNGTFYSLKTPAAFERWVAAATEGFVYAVKGSGFITHRLRLKGAGKALANFYASGVLALGRHTGPFLWQLPPQMQFDPARLEPFLAALPRDTEEAERLARRHDARLRIRARLRSPEPVAYRHAFEVRDASFCVPSFFALLRGYGAALVLSDTGGRFPSVEESTGDFMYVRLHGPRELYASGYTARELDVWADRVEGWRARGQDVYVYFDNDVGAYAPFDAMELKRRVAGREAAAPDALEETRGTPVVDSSTEILTPAATGRTG
jgi:uncharacterized protein YecE (DUF72 family)